MQMASSGNSLPPATSSEFSAATSAAQMGQMFGECMSTAFSLHAASAKIDNKGITPSVVENDAFDMASRMACKTFTQEQHGRYLDNLQSQFGTPSTQALLLDGSTINMRANTPSAALANRRAVYNRLSDVVPTAGRPAAEVQSPSQGSGERSDSPMKMPPPAKKKQRHLGKENPRLYPESHLKLTYSAATRTPSGSDGVNQESTVPFVTLVSPTIARADLPQARTNTESMHDRVMSRAFRQTRAMAVVNNVDTEQDEETIIVDEFAVDRYRRLNADENTGLVMNAIEQALAEDDQINSQQVVSILDSFLGPH